MEEKNVRCCDCRFLRANEPGRDVLCLAPMPVLWKRELEEHNIELDTFPADLINLHNCPCYQPREAK